MILQVVVCIRTFELVLCRYVPFRKTLSLIFLRDEQPQSCMFTLVHFSSRVLPCSVFSYTFRTRPQTSAIKSFFRASFQNHHLWARWVPNDWATDPDPSFKNRAYWFKWVFKNPFKIFKNQPTKAITKVNNCTIFQKKSALFIINHLDLTAILIVLLSTN